MTKSKTWPVMAEAAAYVADDLAVGEATVVDVCPGDMTSYKFVFVPREIHFGVFGQDIFVCLAGFGRGLAWNPAVPVAAGYALRWCREGDINTAGVVAQFLNLVAEELKERS